LARLKTTYAPCADPDGRLQGSGKTTTTARLAKRLKRPRRQARADGLAFDVTPPRRDGTAGDLGVPDRVDTAADRQSENPSDRERAKNAGIHGRHYRRLNMPLIPRAVVDRSEELMQIKVEAVRDVANPREIFCCVGQTA